MGAPDDSARVAREERVVDSLVGLGLLRCRNGEGVDGLVDLDGLHGLDAWWYFDSTSFP